MRSLWGAGDALCRGPLRSGSRRRDAEGLRGQRCRTARRRGRVRGLGAFIDSNVEVELNMIDLNCRSLAQMTHSFGRRFAKRGRGNCADELARRLPGRAARRELRGDQSLCAEPRRGHSRRIEAFGVSVLASAPGPVKSGFGARAGMAITSGQTPEEVAEGTLNALGRRATVRPGLLAKVLEFSLSPLPRSARVYAMGRVMAGMTAHA